MHKIKFRDKWSLITKGVSINSTYQLALSESEFKELVYSKILREDELDDSLIPTGRFVGEFHGADQREFSAKIISSIFRRESMGRAIWLYGTIESESADGIIVNVNFYRTTLMKWFHRTMIIVLALISLPVLFRLFNPIDLNSILIFISALVFFYCFTMFIQMDSVSGQISYFQTHLFSTLEMHKKNGQNYNSISPNPSGTITEVTLL